LPPLDGWIGRVALVFIGISALSSFLALGFLASAILPAKFRYIADDLELLNYAQDLARSQNDPANRSLADPMSAVATLRAALARQYAGATDHNRLINKRRERRRSVAGLATIAAILSTLMLVGTTSMRYAVLHGIEGAAHGRS